MADKKWYERLRDVVVRIARSVGSWFGLDAVSDEISTALNVEKIKNSKDLRNKLDELTARLSKEYNIEMSELQNKMSDLYNLSSSNSDIVKKQVQKQRRKYNSQQGELESKRMKNDAKINYAYSKLDDFENLNETEKAIQGAEKLSSVSDLINKIEGGSYNG